MKREDFESLGTKHKKFEMAAPLQLIAGLPFIVRLDGRAFHTFTKGLLRPFDSRLSSCMIETTKFLVKESHACIGYTQSDEITLIFPASDQMYFSGRTAKINSILAGMASAKFTKLVAENILEKSHLIPCFDSRCYQYPSEELYAECLEWREADATRNSIAMAAQSMFSAKELHKKNIRAMLDMMHSAGTNWNDFPAFFKRGTYVQRRLGQVYLTDDEFAELLLKNPNAKQSFDRTFIVDIELPPVSKISNLADVVFRAAVPTLKD